MVRPRLGSARRVAIGALLMASGLSGCGFLPSPTSPPPSLAVQVRLLDGGLAGLARSDGRIWLMLPSGTNVSAATSAADSPGTTAVHLLALGGQTGVSANSFVFGNAPTGAVTVEVGPGKATGTVRDGLFLVALPQRDMSPSNLSWRFMISTGIVVESGTGITG